MPSAIPHLQAKECAHNGHKEEKTKNAADEIAHGYDDFRRQRQIHAEASKQSCENRHHFPEQQCDDAGSDRYHAHRIDESRLDGALQFDVLFDVRRKTLQNGIQNTAGLTGLDHVDVQGIEDFWRAAHRRREGRAALDLTARSGQDLLKDLVLLLARQNLKTLYERQTGIDHDRELSREDRELLGLHAATESGHAEFLALFGHFRGGDLLPLQQARQLSLVGRGHYSADAGA